MVALAAAGLLAGRSVGETADSCGGAGGVSTWRDTEGVGVSAVRDGFLEIATTATIAAKTMPRPIMDFLDMCRVKGYC